MRWFGKLLTFLAIAAMQCALATSPVAAQTYPYQNPVYESSPTVDAVVCTAACDVVYTSNNIGTVLIRLAGSGTGLAAVAQVSEARNGTIAWSNLQAHPVGGGVGCAATSGSMNAACMYRVDAAGAAQVRVHLTAVTGSISISISGSGAADLVTATPPRKATYSASIVALAPAASATDLVTLTGNATTTVRVNHAECSGISTANATATLEALTRSTANTSGTPAAMTAVPHDTNDPAAAATVTAYTANPTTGTLVGIIRASKLTTGPAASATVVPNVVAWDFGNAPPQQEVVLRGVAQVFAINGAGASFSAGAALNCSLTWTEE